MPDKKSHWENVYNIKQPHEVSWTQDIPTTSLNFITGLLLPKSASIIDIGGGDSNLVDYLLDEGYENITVLDISEKALERAKQRLGKRAENVRWIATDITEFEPTGKYDVWHDRAAFHFLTTQEQIDKYISIAENTVSGHLIIGTFSVSGPLKCSGLEISQYDEAGIEAILSHGFDKVKCITEDHTTPFNTTQNFLFCCFEAKSM